MTTLLITIFAGSVILVLGKDITKSFAKAIELLSYTFAWISEFLHERSK